MKIVGIFNSDEQRVGNRLSGMKTYLARKPEDMPKILDDVEKDSTVRNNCV